MELPKRYEPQEEEQEIQKFWDKNNIYVFNPEAGPAFTIDTPPPTLSGKMHMGHAFSYTQGDFIARYRRMRGDAVFYPFGTDDNGLPTERLIEKQKGVRAKNMPREDFRKIVLKAVEEQLPEFSGDWKRLGISADFGNAYSTIDVHSQKSSQLSFLKLFKDGYIYRKETPVAWCTTCRTAIAQAEFENVDKSSKMNTIAFTSEDGTELSIMTTRPELIPACVALAVHPDDTRFSDVKGGNAIVPLTDHVVPIIEDESVAMDKGTGMMMVCTFGDKEDIEKWHKHDLDLRIIISPEGTLTEESGYGGLRVEDARKQILADLEELGLLQNQESLTHATNVHERCGTPIEFLKTPQWFINVMDHKDELLKIADEITWYPEFMKVRYIHWVENLNWDWCISRQRPYGVPFPVWYDKQGNPVLADESELPIDPTMSQPKGQSNLTPEMDVMDTWATSSCTPQIALDWAENPETFSNQFPMSVRLQAHDIIRTWAFYTITKSLYHHGKQPWNDIIISGHALDPKGKKMSKSKGNVIDPNEVITKYSADALRFWAASTKLGEDLPYQEKDVHTGQKTITKLWNASRFCLMHLAEYDYNVPETDLELFDKWVLTKYMQVVKRATAAFENYEYSITKAEVENFFWNTFCDQYLELVKDRLYNEDRSVEEKRSGLFTLYTVLLGTLKLFAPIMPHITERIYQLYFAEREGVKSIHNSKWPPVLDEYLFEDETKVADTLVDLLGQVRKYKSDNQLSLKTDIEQATLSLPASMRTIAELSLKDFTATGRILDLELADGEPSIDIS